MKAIFRNKDGTTGEMDHEVIQPQASANSDLFILLAFDSWEDVHKEQLIAGVTDVVEFKLINKPKEMGFHGNQD